MTTECSPAQLEFHAFGNREVVGRFDGGRVSSDGGGLLLREVDHRLGLLDRLAACFTDYRNPNGIEHDVRSLVAQRIYGLAMGYEDLNAHDVLRADSVLALLVGKRDLTGEDRERERDKGNPLAGSSTLNRLELTTPDSAKADRYKKIAADPKAFDRLLVDLFMESYDKAPREIWLDLDATDDPCTAIRRAGSSMASTAATAICRCTSSAASICCARGWGHRTGTVRRAASSSSASSARSASVGRRRAS
jgi:hypothetical protein